MGWGRWLLMDDDGRKHDLAERIAEIEILQQRLSKSTVRQASAADELRRLALENNELKLYVAAVYRLLLDKQVVTQTELEAVVATIDGEDGIIDGRFHGSVLTR